MTKLLLHESKRRVGSPGVFITPGTYFMMYDLFQHTFCGVQNHSQALYLFGNMFITTYLEQKKYINCCIYFLKFVLPFAFLVFSLLNIAKYVVYFKTTFWSKGTAIKQYNFERMSSDVSKGFKYFKGR